jgi:hypothetical protein
MSFLHKHLTIPFSTCQTNASDCDYTVCICICTVLDFPTVTSLAIVFKPKCFCILNFSYAKCEERTSLQKSPLPCQREKEGGAGIYNRSTRILGMLPFTVCGLLLVMFPFPNQQSSSSRSQHLDLECCHSHR